VRLVAAINGGDLVKVLGALCLGQGLRLDYLPVQIAFAGSGEEHKVYHDLHIITEKGEVQVWSKRRELQNAERYDSLELTGAQEALEALGELLRALSYDLSALPKESKGPSVRNVESQRPRAKPRSPEEMQGSFTVLVTIQGRYGQRIFEHLRRTAPPHWAILPLTLACGLPTLIDEPADFLPAIVPGADLVLHLGEEAAAAQIVPEIIRRSGAQALIAPIDNPAWMPSGQAKQLEREMEEAGVEHAFPRPFCSLEPEGGGAISEFAKYFGHPSVEMHSADGKTVSSAKVLRGAPCGCTDHVVGDLVGIKLEEAVEKAGLSHHHFPCLASMEREEDLGDTLMHLSGQLLKREIEAKVRRKKEREVNYLEPSSLL
jgi:hypothetical protein